MRKLYTTILVPIIALVTLGCAVPTPINPVHPVSPSAVTWQSNGPLTFTCGVRSSDVNQNAAVLVNLLPGGFSDAQITDIDWAIENVRTFTGINFYTNFSYQRQLYAINFWHWSGTGFSAANAINSNNARTGGDIVVLSDADKLATGVSISTVNSGFRKMIVQRLLNVVGLADLPTGPATEIMSGIFQPSINWGPGTLSGALQKGCYPPTYQKNLYNLIYPNGRPVGPS